MSQPNLKLAFAGTPELACKILESLIDAGEHTVEVVLTQPDRPAGRGRKIKQSEVKLCAIEKNIPVLQPEKSSDLKPEYLNGCDLMLVVAYGLLIKPEILVKPNFGCINIHTSLLPRWRGAAPIQRAIEAGDKNTGITFMQMEQGLDTGPILEQVTCEINANDTGGQLHDRLAEIGANNINQLLTKIANNNLNPIKQDDSKSTYANKISKQEAKIDWTKSAIELERKVRAFNPFPVTHTQINDLNFRIWEADIKSDSENLTPGTVLKNKSSLDIVTGEGVLAITKLQLAGKRMMTAKEFFNGHPDFFTEKRQAN
ncbi:MAG: methionyl-tRNA formyltransferase [Proteobacteria bacterium]|nr:methionyl-tRNA formyltransferase [Pseudomonadota bacterium]NOG60228.1 methionyl-tRNA formyltransferase [Pseudomonadota bacterium]